MLVKLVNKLIMTKKRYHVTKTEDGWKGELENAKRASVIADTKEEAMERTIKIAKNYGNSEVIIHKIERNIIQEERTYPKSADPIKTKG